MPIISIGSDKVHAKDKDNKIHVYNLIQNNFQCENLPYKYCSARHTMPPLVTDFFVNRLWENITERSAIGDHSHRNNVAHDYRLQLDTGRPSLVLF